MLLNDYDSSVYTEEDGVAALHVSAMLLDAHPHAAFHMVSIGAVPLFVSRACSGSLPRSTRLRCLAILHRLCVILPAASIALGRVMPEVLLTHLEIDGGCDDGDDGLTLRECLLIFHVNCREGCCEVVAVLSVKCSFTSLPRFKVDIHRLTCLFVVSAKDSRAA